MNEPPLPHLTGAKIHPEAASAQEGKTAKNQLGLWQSFLWFGLVFFQLWLFYNNIKISRFYHTALTIVSFVPLFLAFGSLGAGAWFYRQWRKQKRSGNSEP